MHTFDSMMAIAGSDLGRLDLSGLSSLITIVEEAIAEAKSCGDGTAQAAASERSATTRAATSDSSTIDAVERLTRLNGSMTESLMLQHEILMLMHEALKRFIAIQGPPNGRPRTVYTLHGARATHGGPVTGTGVPPPIPRKYGDPPVGPTPVSPRPRKPPSP